MVEAKKEVYHLLEEWEEAHYLLVSNTGVKTPQTSFILTDKQLIILSLVLGLDTYFWIDSL